MVDDNKLYSVEEIAEIFRFHKNTIYKLLRSGEIHGVKYGEKGTWRIPGKAINKYLYG